MVSSSRSPPLSWLVHLDLKQGNDKAQEGCGGEIHIFLPSPGVSVGLGEHAAGVLPGNGKKKNLYTIQIYKHKDI